MMLTSIMFIAFVLVHIEKDDNKVLTTRCSKNSISQFEH